MLHGGPGACHDNLLPSKTELAKANLDTPLVFLDQKRVACYLEHTSGYQNSLLSSCFFVPFGAQPRYHA